MTFLCTFKSDAGQSSDGQSAFNPFVDSVDNWIRADRTAGCAADSTGPYAGTGLVFSFGEGGVDGGDDIHWTFPIPHTHEGGVMVFIGICEVTTVQILDT